MPKWLYQFYIPTNSMCFSSSTPSPALATVNHFNCRHSSLQVGISHCGSNLHIPNAYDIGHLFHVLIFHPCIFFSDVSVHILLPFYIGSYVFLLLCFESFNIFWIGKSLLSNLWFANVAPCLWFISHYLARVFQRIQFLILVKFNFSFFFSFTISLWCCIWKIFA